MTPNMDNMDIIQPGTAGAEHNNDFYGKHDEIVAKPILFSCEGAALEVLFVLVTQFKLAM